ncbi:unnamed protein product, partial [Clonostachys solani]
MVRGRSSPEDQMRHARRIFDGVVLRQEAAETPTADDGLLVAEEVTPDAFDVVDNLVKRVWFCPGALPVASVVE